MNEFWSWWQHLPEKMNPVIFNIGGFKIQYYGVMYIVAFAVCYALVMYRLKHEKRFRHTPDDVQDVMVYMIFGVLIGGRIGYVLFYNLPYYLQHPLEIFLPFQISGGFRFTGISGMSFHGGLIAVIVATWLYTRKAGLGFWNTADLFAPAVPLGYTFGRIGNFINGELYGRVTSAPVGMYFPLSGGLQRRHPSQLYEAFFEGIFLFFILWNLRNIRTPRGSMMAFYLIGYGTIRFFIEYFRQPDSQLGFVWLSFSMGQVLCSLMIAGGVFLYMYLYRTDHKRTLL